MKQSLMAVLIAALFAGVVTSATAKDDSTMSPSNASAQVGGAPDNDPYAQNEANGNAPVAGQHAKQLTQAESKGELNAAKDKAQSQYKVDKVKCDRMSGEARLSCDRDAKAAHNAAIAYANTEWERRSDMHRSGASETSQDVAKPVTDGMGDSDERSNGRQ